MINDANSDHEEPTGNQDDHDYHNFWFHCETSTLNQPVKASRKRGLSSRVGIYHRSSHHRSSFCCVCREQKCPEAICISHDREGSVAALRSSDCTVASSWALHRGGQCRNCNGVAWLRAVCRRLLLGEILAASCQRRVWTGSQVQGVLN